MDLTGRKLICVTVLYSLFCVSIGVSFARWYRPINYGHGCWMYPNCVEFHFCPDCGQHWILPQEGNCSRCDQRKPPRPLPNAEKPNGDSRR